MAPGDKEIEREVAELYYIQKRYEEAIPVYERLMESEPRNTWYCERLGELYYKMNKKKKALAIWKKIIEIEPDRAYSYTRVGRIYKKYKLYEEAVEMYQKALELTDKEGERKNILREMLEVYEKTGRMDELAQELERKLKEE